MKEITETSFGIGDRTYSIVKEFTDKSSTYDGCKGFFEDAVAEQLPEIQRLATGSREARNLIEALDDIRWIDETIPEDDGRALLRRENGSDHQPRVELTPEQDKQINMIKTSTGLSRSEIIRRCVFRYLYENIQGPFSIQGRRKDFVNKKWSELERGMLRPVKDAQEILNRRFVDDLTDTVKKMDADPQGASWFADEYTNKFQDSSAYEAMISTSQGVFS